MIIRRHHDCRIQDLQRPSGLIAGRNVRETKKHSGVQKYVAESVIIVRFYGLSGHLDDIDVVEIIHMYFN